MRPIRLIGHIQTAILLLLALGTPVVAVLDEKFWFEKRVALAGAAVVLLALLVARAWTRGTLGGVTPRRGVTPQTAGWLLFGAALLVTAVVPAGRIGNLATPDLWVGVGAVLAYFAIKNTTTSSKQIKLVFWAAVAGVAAAAALSAVEIGGAGVAGGAGSVTEQGKVTLEILQRSPIWGEFREFRVARLGILQIASGLGILGILGTLGVAYQLGLAAVKGIIKDSSIWWKVLNLLVLVLLAGFLILPHPALMLWPLAVAAGLACGISTAGVAGEAGGAGTIKRFAWAGFVGLLAVAILGSSYGLGRAVWGEIKFREALAAANRNEGITTYYALLESIRRNPYEVRYHLLASQIDIALANSIAAQAAQGAAATEEEEEATPSAQLTAQDQNNILILIQQAVVEGKEAIKLDPENSLLWQNLAAIYRGLVGVAGGAEDWALKCCQRAIELAPKDPSPHLFVGEIHFLAGNFQGAAEAFQEAARLAPHFARAHYNLAIAYNALGEIDKAIEELRETLARLPADSPDREQVEKDLSFLKGEIGQIGPIGPMEEETGELKEATSSAEVEAPPPPVGPEEATESAETKPIEVIP